MNTSGPSTASTASGGPDEKVASRVARLREVKLDAIERLDLAERSWLILSATPETPGDARINSATFKEFTEQALTRSALIVGGIPNFSRTYVGRRQLVADDAYDSSGAQFISANLHVDGSGAFSLAMAHLGLQSAFGTESETQVTLIDDEWISIALISGLDLLSAHAKDRALASGQFSIHAQLVSSAGTTDLQIGHTRRYGFPQSLGRPIHFTAARTWFAETVTDLDGLLPVSSSLVAVASTLANELGQAFGVPELGQLAPDGAVRRMYWGKPHGEQVVAWATDRGVAVSDETLT
jgi:hypothetical protein